MDIQKIKYLYENAPATVLALVSGGFFLSLIYNVSYFDKIGKIEFLTLLSFSDYVESSLLFIVLIIIAIFYGQIIHVDTDGIIGRFKAARETQKEVKKSVEETKKPFKLAINIVGSTLNIIITVIQLFGVTLLYWVIAYFAFSAYSNALQSPALDEAVFLNTVIAVVPLMFFLDIFIAMRPKEYEVRKIAFKILIIASAMSYAIGAYDASRALTKQSVRNGSEVIFLRGINKGAFSLKLEERKIIFEPWDQVKVIGE